MKFQIKQKGEILNDQIRKDEKTEFIHLVAVFQVDDGVVHRCGLYVLSEAALQHFGFFSAQSLPAALLLGLQLPHHIRAVWRGNKRKQVTSYNSDK